jgi:geranylgeranyl pyrophosphate synthase
MVNRPLTAATAPHNLDAFLRRSTERVDRALDAVLPPDVVEPCLVHRAMRYSVFAGGKRFRPALVYLGALAAGGEEEPVDLLACAVEMIHTYSLIHDDLPAMDDDSMRRGKPSCHAAFGEATAILAGDALHTMAFEVLARFHDRSLIGPLVTEIARACGTEGMVGGQAADLENEGRTPDESVVEGIHRRKTGALITSSLRAGAIASRAPEPVVRAVTEYGRRVGLAFQVIDDVLDEEGAGAELGKTPGKDRRRGKMTYPAALGIEGARTTAHRLVDESLQHAAGLPCAGLLEDLARRIVERRS